MSDADYMASSKFGDTAVGMYIVGDSVEREIDGLWFVGEVRVVNAAVNEIDECSYDIYYSDIDNLETNVPESELRLSQKSLNDGDQEQNLPAGKVLLGDPVNNEKNINGTDIDESKIYEQGTKESHRSEDSSASQTKSKVVFHDQDVSDNSKLQSTGTAYVLHGVVTDRVNPGGSGLRAIRALRKK